MQHAGSLWAASNVDTADWFNSTMQDANSPNDNPNAPKRSRKAHMAGAPGASGALVAPASDDGPLSRSLTGVRRGDAFNAASGHPPPPSAPPHTTAGWARQVGQEAWAPGLHGGLGLPHHFRPRQPHPPQMPNYATGQVIGDHEHAPYGRLNIRLGQQQPPEALHMTDGNNYPSYMGQSHMGSWQGPSGWGQPDPSPRSAAGEAARASLCSREWGGVGPSQAYHQPSVERLHQIHEQDDAPLQRVTTSPALTSSLTSSSVTSCFVTPCSPSSYHLQQNFTPHR